MKTLPQITLYIFILLNCKTNLQYNEKRGDRLPEVINSTLNTIDKNSQFDAYQQYVYETRKQAVKYLNLQDTAFNHIDRFAMIDEYAPLSNHIIVGEIFLFNNRRYQYEKLGDQAPITASQTNVSGRQHIINYLQNNDLDGLIAYAKDQSKTISDGAFLFISFYNKGECRSILIPQFDVNWN